MGLHERIESIGWAIYRGWNYYWGPRILRRKLRSFWQRGWRGWADEDTWSMDSYLNRVIVEMCAQIREDAHGYPASLLEPDDYDPIGGTVIGDDEKMDEWRQILTWIMEGFAADSLLSDSVHYTLVDGKLEHDTALQAKLEIARARGFGLFQKYYGALWT